jgi:hypothetical protein
MVSCPHCTKIVSHARSVEAIAPPHAGDFLICHHCFRWTVFDDELQLRKPNLSELELLATDARFARALERERSKEKS